MGWLLLLSLAAGCTDTVVEMQAPAGAEPWAFSARTLDDTKLYLATLEVNARGRSFAADAPDGMGGAGAGLRWRNTYGFVGVTWAASTPGVYDDGLNERGLSVAQNQLDESSYPNVTHPGAAVGMRAVVGWLLGRAADVAEARALLEDGGAQVWGKAGGGPGGDAGAERQHLHLLDAAASSLWSGWGARSTCTATTRRRATARGGRRRTRRTSPRCARCARMGEPSRLPSPAWATDCSTGAAPARRGAAA